MKVGQLLNVYGDSYYTNIVVQDSKSNDEYWHWDLEEEYDWYVGQKSYRYNIPDNVYKLEIENFYIGEYRNHDIIWIKVKTPMFWR